MSVQLFCQECHSKGRSMSKMRATVYQQLGNSQTTTAITSSQRRARVDGSTTLVVRDSSLLADWTYANDQGEMRTCGVPERP